MHIRSIAAALLLAGSLGMPRAPIATLAASSPQGSATTALGASNDLRLWYRRAAPEWNQALPIGNGRLGGMVFGSVRRERIQLNEDSLWMGGPRERDNPGALAALPDIR